MPPGWIKNLPMTALLLSALVTLSGCNTVSGTISGIGKDISMIGNTLGGVSGDCSQERCAEARSNCGPRGCRQGRRVVSGCAGSSCGPEYRSPRYERASYRNRHSSRQN